MPTLTTWTMDTMLPGLQTGMWRPKAGRCLQSLSPSPHPSSLSYPPPTLVLRCLGVPTRVVTNYNSAHDQNSNLLIEYFRNEFGEIQGDKSEMIW